MSEQLDIIWYRTEIKHLRDMVEEFRKREESQDAIRELLTAERDALLAQRSLVEEYRKELILTGRERDAALATIERVKTLAESWRYKGEFGWGAWQEGEGPDQEGWVLNHAAGELRAVLDAPEPASLVFVEPPDDAPPMDGFGSWLNSSGLGDDTTTAQTGQEAPQEPAEPVGGSPGSLSPPGRHRASQGPETS